VAFVNYSTVYPGYVHHGGLSSTLLKSDIRGNMWYHLRARFDKIKLRVFHPGISAHHTVDILRGLSEALFRIFVAEYPRTQSQISPKKINSQKMDNLQLLTLDVTSQTLTPSDLLRTFGAEAYSMLTT